MTTMNSDATPKIREILAKVVNGNIENFKITVNNTNKKGDGYLGQIFFVTLEDRKSGKELNLVVKQAFSDKKIREFGPIREIFLNEIYFYTKLWPKFLEFQQEIPPAYRFDNIAKCFATISEENYERLVLQNIKNQGFELHKKKNALEMDKFELIFKVYGRFHAISFAYKALRPEEYSVLVSKIPDVWDIFGRMDNFSVSTKFTTQLCLDSLQPGVDDELIEKFKHYVDGGIDLFLGSLVHGKHVCITHGDCWSNNMMFKHDDSGTLMDLRLLDFQLVRLGSPVCDLSYCLYSGGTKETFDELDHLLQVYHDSLSESLKAFGCDPNKLYPLEALKNEWKVHCQLGVIMGFTIWLAKQTYDEEVLDLTDLSDDREQDIQKFYDVKYDKETYARRAKDIITHLYERDYLL